MTRLRVPPGLVNEGRQFVADFHQVTGEWVRQGWHTSDEVAEWIEVIRMDMQNELSVNPLVDPRCRNERVLAWCATFSKAAAKLRAVK